MIVVDGKPHATPEHQSFLVVLYRDDPHKKLVVYDDPDQVAFVSSVTGHVVYQPAALVRACVLSIEEQWKIHHQLPNQVPTGESGPSCPRGSPGPVGSPGEARAG